LVVPGSGLMFLNPCIFLFYLIYLSFSPKKTYYMIVYNFFETMIAYHVNMLTF